MNSLRSTWRQAVKQFGFYSRQLTGVAILAAVVMLSAGCSDSTENIVENSTDDKVLSADGTTTAGAPTAGEDPFDQEATLYDGDPAELQAGDLVLFSGKVTRILGPYGALIGNAAWTDDYLIISDSELPAGVKENDLLQVSGSVETGSAAQLKEDFELEIGTAAEEEVGNREHYLISDGWEVVNAEE